ncbi:MAG: hypothetical protein JRJ59_05500, partial [Deltaproteobacteria bacterium]|nr:hypothetical protein [Deltaproteobacteria bacterium]
MAAKSLSMEMVIGGRVSRNLTRSFKRTERQAQRLGSVGSRSMSKIERRSIKAGAAVTQSFARAERALTRLQRRQAVFRAASAGLGRGLDRVANRYSALIGGAAGVGAVRMVARLQERFTRLGIQARISQKEVNTLKREIFE